MVGVPTDEQPADNTPLVPGYANGSTSGNLRMLGQAGEDAMRNIIAGVPFWRKGGALINSYVNGSSYPDELDNVRAEEQAAAARQGPVASFGEQAVGTMLPGRAIAKGLGAVGTAAKGIPLVGRVLGNGLVQAGATGAALGAGSAAGNDQDVGTGALYGAGAGAAGVHLGWAAGKVAGGVANKVVNSAFNKTNGAGLTANAADKLSEALASQGQTPTQAVAAAQAMGPGATLADAGPATQNLTSRLAAQEPTVGQSISAGCFGTSSARPGTTRG